MTVPKSILVFLGSLVKLVALGQRLSIFVLQCWGTGHAGLGHMNMNQKSKNSTQLLLVKKPRRIYAWRNLPNKSSKHLQSLCWGTCKVRLLFSRDIWVLFFPFVCKGNPVNKSNQPMTSPSQPLLGLWNRILKQRCKYMYEQQNMLFLKCSMCMSKNHVHTYTVYLLHFRDFPRATSVSIPKFFTTRFDCSSALASLMISAQRGLLNTCHAKQLKT